MAFRTEHLIPDPLRDRDLSSSDVWDRELEIEDNERVLVKASSGSGKTTLFSILYGMRKDHQGEALWDGRSISRVPRKEWTRIRREELGMVFQDLKLFEELSVRENLLIKDRLTQRLGEQRILGALERLGVRDQWEKPVYQLSTGQKQRIAIIRALCQPFRMLLLDEPFSHLDPENVQKAVALILERVEEEQGGMLLSSLQDPYGVDYDRILRL